MIPKILSLPPFKAFKTFLYEYICNSFHIKKLLQESAHIQNPKNSGLFLHESYICFVVTIAFYLIVFHTP